MESYWPIYILLPANKLISNKRQATLQEIYIFQQQIGSIIYTAVVIQADTAYTVNLLSRFLLNLLQKYLEAADYCLVYLDTYKTLAIQYSNQPNQITVRPRVFSCSSDTAFADNTDCKSSYRYLFKLYRRPIV